MKLTKLQIHKIDTALSESSSVLAEIKKKTLKGKDLEDMKTLESAVQSIEVFRLRSR